MPLASLPFARLVIIGPPLWDHQLSNRIRGRSRPAISSNHQCINFRHGSARVYRWEFDKGKKSLTAAANGPLIVDDVEILIRAAVDGVGPAFNSENRAQPYMSGGGLVRADWDAPVISLSGRQ
jgi:DNA-binding transcriptional LysR family regulator